MASKKKKNRRVTTHRRYLIICLYGKTYPGGGEGVMVSKRFPGLIRPCCRNVLKSRLNEKKKHCLPPPPPQPMKRTLYVSVSRRFGRTANGCIRYVITIIRNIYTRLCRVIRPLLLLLSIYFHVDIFFSVLF